MTREGEEPKEDDDALPVTSLAELAKAARERIGPEPDRVTPQATRTMAAIVRDLKGMPDLAVSREATHKLRLGRRGKVGSLTLEYHANIRAMELGYVGTGDGDPNAVKLRRYTLDLEKNEWSRIHGGGELIEDIREGMLGFYPELRPAT